MLSFRSQGFSLLEVVVAIAIGGMMMLAIAETYPRLLQQNQTIYRRYRLEQAMRQGLFSLQKDLRRAGFSFDMTGSLPVIISHHQSESAASCVIIRYDFNRNGKIELTGSEADSFAYRLHQGALEHFRGGADCQGSGWEKLFDPSEIVITDFKVEQHVADAPYQSWFLVYLRGEWVGQAHLNREIIQIIKGENL